MASLLAVLVGGAIALLGSVWLFQRRLIYLPGPSPGPPPSCWQEVHLETSDGLTLDAWLGPAPPDPAAGAAIVFPGNAGSRIDRLHLGERLTGGGLRVLLVDYRGYGGNPGSPTEEGLALDARAARRFVEENALEQWGPVIYYGESLGAAVAVELTSEYPPDLLVLRSPFTSLVDVGSFHYRFLPIARLLKDRYPSLRRASSITSPVVVIAGRLDRIVPYSQSVRLFEAFPGRKRFVTIEAADHNDATLVDHPFLIDEIIRGLRPDD